MKTFKIVIDGLIEERINNRFIRKNWNGKKVIGVKVGVHVPLNDDVINIPFLYEMNDKELGGIVCPYVPSPDDLLANDWDMLVNIGGSFKSTCNDDGFKV